MDLLADANPIEQRLVEKANRLYIPISTAFELSPVCNLNCDMCYVRLSKKETIERGGCRDMSFGSVWLKSSRKKVHSSYYSRGENLYSTLILRNSI